MRYGDNIDYLFSSIIYLGTHTFWWARSPRAMAAELQLDEEKLRAVFDGFPGLFRKSVRTNPETGQHFYALQARYAQRKGGDVKDPEQESYIEPLNPEKLQVLIDFVHKMVEHENKADDRDSTRRSALRGSAVAVGAAVLAACAAIVAASIRHP
jgi:hypothetical protein